MGHLSGVTAIGDYTTGSPTNKDTVDRLIALIPNPDAAHGTGAVGGGDFGALNTYLDEMNPAAASQLIAELTALKAAIENV